MLSRCHRRSWGCPLLPIGNDSAKYSLFVYITLKYYEKFNYRNCFPPASAFPKDSESLNKKSTKTFFRCQRKTIRYRQWQLKCVRDGLWRTLAVIWLSREKTKDSARREAIRQYANWLTIISWKIYLFFKNTPNVWTPTVQGREPGTAKSIYGYGNGGAASKG